MPNRDRLCKRRRAPNRRHDHRKKTFFSTISKKKRENNSPAKERKFLIGIKGFVRRGMRPLMGGGGISEKERGRWAAKKEKKSQRKS